MLDLSFLFIGKTSLYISLGFFAAAAGIIIFEMYRFYKMNKLYKREPEETLRKFMLDIKESEREVRDQLNHLYGQRRAACGDCKNFRVNCWGSPAGKRCEEYKKII